MSFLTHNEKIVLIFLIVGTIITLYVIAYLTSRTSNTYQKVGPYVINTTRTPVSGSMHHDLPDTITPQVWNDLAEDIYRVYHQYDSFVVVCDRSVIPHISSPLSFIIENLSKPVIITPPEEVKDSVKVASLTRIPEVMVFSHGKLLRGVRINRSLMSPHLLPLTPITGLKPPTAPTTILKVKTNVVVGVVRMFPGIDSKYIKSIGSGIGTGLILEGTKIPTTKGFLQTISDMITGGVVVVAVVDKLDPKVLKAGVLSGYDMTTEAAHAKLSFLLSNVPDKSLIPQLMGHNLRGELTEEYTHHPKVA